MLSINWKLPLLITAVLAAGLVAILAFTYFALTRRSESIVRDRFAHATKLVARTVQEAIDQRRELTADVAASPEVARLLAAPRVGNSRLTTDSAAAAKVLARLLTRDSLGVMLTDLDGRVVAATGHPLPVSVPIIDPKSVVPLSSDDALGAVRVSPMMHAGERTLFWVVGPVMANNARVGYVVEPRWVVGPPTALQMLRELTREDLSLYLRNIDGGGWTNTPGRPAPPPRSRDSTRAGLYYERVDGGRMIAQESPIAGTPWLIVIESPSHHLFARLRTTIEQLAWMSLLLLAGGAAIAWALGRRITRPIVALTSAANQVATGTYQQPIPHTGADEIGQLTRRFHEMAEQVTDARRELEQRAADAQLARAEAERARADAEAANRAKSDFLAMMSHELRTPLNAIAGYAELLEMGIHGPVTDAQREALNRIARSQAHLLTLINDVLNFARIDAGQVRYVVQDVRMTETLAGLEPLVEPQMAARRLTFVPDACDAGIVAAADVDKVRQVVLNLLGNAVKYTPEGGTVRLTCDADASTVRIHVRDTGPGIEPDQLPVIFEAFVQGHRALNRPNEGVGLGLAISRDLARGMGGDVTVATELGVGSTFTLVLPRAGVRAPIGDDLRAIIPTSVGA